METNKLLDVVWNLSADSVTPRSDRTDTYMELYCSHAAYFPADNDTYQMIVYSMYLLICVARKRSFELSRMVTLQVSSSVSAQSDLRAALPGAIRDPIYISQDSDQCRSLIRLDGGTDLSITLLSACDIWTIFTRRG